MKTHLQLLQEKLPQIRDWVERTVASHRAASRTTASFGFPRLGLFYSAQLLDAARVVVLPRVPVPPLTAMGVTGFADFEQLDSVGITYLDTYFVQADSVQDESLHFHELVHIIQWRRLGADRFLMAYALGHILAGGYRGNPLEVIAYRLQSRFAGHGAAFNVEAEVRLDLDVSVASLLARASV